MSQKLTKAHIEDLALNRNHVLITPNFEEVYKSVKSTLTFKCLTCQSTFQATVHSYKNAKKTGCPECKKVQTSQTHKGKIVSNQTRALIGEKASQRPGSLKNKFGENHPRFKGGYGRDKKTRSFLDYCWINGIKKLYNNTCVLTGAKIQLECHHLDSWNHAIDRRHDLKNGVLIAHDIHEAFHKTYGYGNNTEAQFSEFCKNRYNVDWFEMKQKIESCLLNRYLKKNKKYPLAGVLIQQFLYGNHQPSLTQSQPMNNRLLSES